MFWSYFGAVRATDGSALITGLSRTPEPSVPPWRILIIFDHVLPGGSDRFRVICGEVE